MLDRNLFTKITGKSKAGIEIETTYPMYEKENVLFDIFPNIMSKMDAEGLFDIKDLLMDFSILGEPGISDRTNTLIPFITHIPTGRCKRNVTFSCFPYYI